MSTHRRKAFIYVEQCRFQFKLEAGCPNVERQFPVTPDKHQVLNFKEQTQTKSGLGRLIVYGNLHYMET